MTREYINDAIISVLTRFPGISSVVFYGSYMYKDIEQVRDIDVIAYTSSANVITGRADILLKSVNKKVSVMIININDLYDDIYNQKFASKLAIFLFHGYKPILNPDQCYVFYEDCLISIINHYTLIPYKEPSMFFKINNYNIMMQFPNYVKSGIDYFTCPELYSNINHLYKSAYPNLGKYKSSEFTNNDNLDELTKAIVCFFRRCCSNLSTDLATKHKELILKLYTNESILVSIYGKNAFNSLIQNIDTYYNGLLSYPVDIMMPFQLKNYGIIECI